MEDNWNQREQQVFSNRKSHQPQFFSWFSQYKAKEFREYTLRSLREETGLGSPPKAYYTNDNESINSLLKETTNYKKQQWGMFNDKMKKLVEQQQREVEKAVINCGRYRLRSEYTFLAVAEDKWFRMTEAQCIQHLKKFNTCSVRQSEQIDQESLSSQPGHSLQSHDITVGQFQLGQINSLSVLCEDATVATRLPKETIEGIWTKAAMLKSDSNAITFAPGCGKKDRMVKSMSKVSPHLVTVTKNSQYKCDESCLQHKSLAVCSHVVAAAESNGDLLQFLEWYNKSRGKQPINMTPLALEGMPAGAGRKGGRAPRKRSRTKLIPTDENRVPLTPTSSNKSVVPGKTTDNSSACTSGNTAGSNPSPFPISPVNTSIPLPLTYGGPSFSPTYLPQFQQASSSQSVSYYAQCMTSPSAALASSTSPVTASPISGQLQEFVLCFKTGNIRVCNGCHSKFTQFDDVVVKHYENRKFLHPQSGLPMSKFGNAYYHCQIFCIELNWRGVFDPKNIVVPYDVQSRLSVASKQLIFQQFGLQL